eukprot:4991927-Alexandrium_andersonii.AAC.1
MTHAQSCASTGKCGHCSPDQWREVPPRVVEHVVPGNVLAHRPRLFQPKWVERLWVLRQTV